MKFSQYLKLKINEILKVDLKKGEEYEIPNNIGGVFYFKYIGKEGNKHKFQSTTKG